MKWHSNGVNDFIYKSLDLHKLTISYYVIAVPQLKKLYDSLIKQFTIKYSAIVNDFFCVASHFEWYKVFIFGNSREQKN